VFRKHKRKRNFISVDEWKLFIVFRTLCNGVGETKKFVSTLCKYKIYNRSKC